ncbi:putative late blight resistance proteinR1C-3 [Sesamum alatum]|uniref:Late blight resistance proteinR1C-3 n=1 Tax=Sesamum alatum TaxID=300844 RepID=A0AAE2CX35_9LAMI|nr:putative late blight resistance proteinR1C-3 [Sesamum alatum]
MAVAAYASLLSLMHVLDNVEHPARRCQVYLHTKRTRILQEKLEFLLGYLELHSQRISQEMEDVARQIVVFVDEAEHIIDFHVVNQLREGSQDKRRYMAARSSFCQDVDSLIEEIDSITKKLMMVKEEWVDVQEQQALPVAVGSTTLPSGDKNTMVEVDERLLRVVDELTRDEPNLQILPIVGMGGIGKTTLAQNAFDHPYIVNRFDMRIWFTISQQYSVRKILLKYLLNDEKNKNGTTNNKKNEEKGENLDELGVAELGERLYKFLFGKRYLIIMDDVWSIKAWEDLKLSFPNNENGSRILVTTRLLDVARPLGFHNHYFTINFLDEDKSWNLLCEKVFAQKSCPCPELEEIGRNIAKGCRGLPLAIVVVGGLLAKSSKTQEYWKFVAENVSTFVNSGDDEYCLKILSLSYNSLPIHLKPCFLYMRVFPEDHEIKASELTKLWISEGFIKPVRGKSLEEVGDEYLKDLIDRNLILIRKWKRSGKIKTCSVHDILRELCFRESNREHLIRVPRAQHVAFSREHGDSLCFLCGHLDGRDMINLPEVVVGLRPTIIASPLVCEACVNMYQDLSKLRWVKVIEQIDHHSSENFLQHTKLRYLVVEGRCNGWADLKFVFPHTISLLWNLQTLDLDVGVPYLEPLLLPSDIWDMPQLRHLNAWYCTLRDPLINRFEGKDSIVLENLSTLSSRGFRCSEEAVKRIPNMKKLKSSYDSYSADDSCYCLSNLAHLNKLESLSLECFSLLEDIAFPTSLKKLSLFDCIIPWEKMTIIGSLLPNLEVLKLNDAFHGYTWDPIEGEFLWLKVLFVSRCDLVRWGAEDIHFSNLQSLALKNIGNTQGSKGKRKRESSSLCRWKTIS